MKKDIGKELRLIRKFNHLSLRALEEKTGISYSRLGKFERGEESPTKEIIIQIENAININFNEIYRKSIEIDKLFEDFLNSLFYHDENTQLFKTKIKKEHDKFNLNYKYGKILLIEYILYVLEGKIDEAESLEEELFAYFKNDLECEAILYQYKGLYYRICKDNVKAIYWLEKALSVVLNDKTKAMICYHLSASYMDVRRMMASIKSIEFAKTIFSDYGSFRRVMYCQNEYALALLSTGNYSASIDHFHRVLKASETINCPESYIAMTYRNMCWTMILAKNYESALEYLEEAMMIEAKHPFAVLYGIWCNYKLERYEEAEIIILENEFMKTNKQYSSNFELFLLLIKYKKNKPTKQLVDLAVKIVNSFDGKENFERIIFYIDIVLELFGRQGNDSEKIKYLEMKINLLQNGRLCRN